MSHHTTTATPEAERITRFMEKPDGGHSLELTVCGVRVLLSPDREHQAMAEGIAEAIARMWPLAAPAVVPAVQLPAVQRVQSPPAQPNWVVGDRAYCTVHGCQGWNTVTAVQGAGARQRIKIEGYRSWCPGSNFSRTGP